MLTVIFKKRKLIPLYKRPVNLASLCFISENMPTRLTRVVLVPSVFQTKTTR
jgi:hypothetical protein